MKEPPHEPLQCGSAAAAPIEFEFIRKKWEQGDLNGLQFWKGGVLNLCFHSSLSLILEYISLHKYFNEGSISKKIVSAEIV